MKFIYVFLIFILSFTKLFSNEKLNFTNVEKQWIKDNPIVTYSEVNWKPLSIIESNRMKGIMGDYLDVVAKKTGIEFKFIPSNSWSHVLEQFREKKIDLIPGIDSSFKEANLGLVSKVYSSYPMVIVTSKKYKYVNGLDDLKGKTLVVPKYYTSYNFVSKNYKDIKLITTTNIPEALLLVEKTKADAFVGHIATSLYYIAETHLKNLKVSGTTSFRFEHRYLVQNNNKILLSIVNKVIDSITYEEKKEIYSNWIQTSIVEKSMDFRIIAALLFIATLIISYLLYRHQLLKKSYKVMNSILNTTIDGVVISKNRKCIEVNDSALEILKSKKEDLIGRDILDFVVHDDKEKVLEALKKSILKPYEVRVVIKDKLIVPILIKGSNLQMNGELIRVHSFVDLTQTKQKDAILYQQTKMAAMGEMIGNIAHQWRQPLSTISVAATGIKLQKELNCLKDKEFYSAIDAINNSTQYLSKTIDDFRNFFNPSTKEYKEVDIKEIIEDTLKLVETQYITKEIHIIKNIKSVELFTIKNEFIQVLVNILNNAKDALVEKKKKKLILIESYEEENNLCLKVIDSAGGIEEEIVDRIFEPYFTTKHMSQGTGIGLYMSEEIISNHLNGRISVHNRSFEYKEKEYYGACFTITVPLKKDKE